MAYVHFGELSRPCFCVMAGSVGTGYKNMDDTAHQNVVPTCWVSLDVEMCQWCWETTEEVEIGWSKL